MRPPNSHGVPVVPNAADVRGTLIAQTHTDDNTTLLTIAVEATNDVESLPNFVRPHVGERIDVTIPPGSDLQVPEHSSFELRVAYRGDERGGRFVLVDRPS